MFLYSIILLVASFVSIYLAAICFRYRKATGAQTFGFLLIAVGFYTFGYSFEIRSQSLDEILFWLKIEYTGISFIPALLIIFSLSYVGKEKWLNNYLFAGSISLSLATFLIHLTNSTTHWFYAEINLGTETSALIIQTSKGFWYWIHQAYSMVSMISFNLLFGEMYLKGDRLKRKQALIMELSSIPSWIFYLIYITGHFPYGIDPIPFSFIIMSFIITWGLMKFKMFDFAPIALGNVFETMADASIIVDNDFQILNHNKEAQRLFGSLTNKNLSSLLPDLFPEYRKIPDLLYYLESPNNGLEILTEGTYKQYNARVSQIKASSGLNIGYALIFRDITNIKNTEKLLLNNEARLQELNKTKDKLISILSHDMRGSLGNIRNISGLLKDEIEKLSMEDKKRITNLIYDSSDQTLKLLENILLWVTNQSSGIQYHIQTVNLNESISETIKILQPIAIEKEIAISNALTDDWTIQADPQMIFLVLRNLISNAIKFTQRQGSISITGYRDEKETTIEISDTGIGIPDEIADNLFSLKLGSKRKGTENEPGTGLGLLLCKEVIENLGGTIGLKKSSKEGSTFYFTLTNHLLKSS